MITCRDCNKSFPKPATRGRPPVKCAPCRKGPQIKVATLVTRKKRTAKAKPTPKRKRAVAPVVDESQFRLPPKGKYLSGFCGGSMFSDGGWRTHAPHIHKMCHSDICTCDCHRS